MSWLESKGQVVTPSRAMRLALEEARLGWGFVSPNPLVGCAIVDKDHRLLGVGFHERVGADHAEISALKAVGDNSKINGAHIYVTLEPCAHQGRTGSCAQALAPLKPASVTYAVEDPNPLVAGKGAAVLLEAGVRCEHISQRADIPDRRELELLAEKLAEVFLHNHRTKEPFIGLKVATSTDGMMASSSGEPRWLTGAESRTHVHWLRAGYDAVLVGRGTFDVDDPSLNVRHDDFPGFENKAILLDPSGRSFSKLLSSNLLSSHEAENIFVVVSDGASLQANMAKENEAVDALSHLGLQLIQVPVGKDGEFDVPSLLSKLYQAGITSIMVEGGSRTYGAFVRAKRVHRLHVYKGPLTIGKELGLPWAGGFDEADLMKSADLTNVETLTLGFDVYSNYSFKYK